MSPDVSVVLPVYNGASAIASSVARLEETLTKRPGTWEIVVVDDGSTDGTAAHVVPSARVKLVALPQNRGKFGALKVGMTAAAGRCRIFTDADLPYDLEAFDYVASLVLSRGFHVVVGDRTLAGSIYGARIPRTRAVASPAFSLLVRLLVTGGLFDTQCGLKGFRGDVADALFPLLTIDGFAGDVELLYVALKYNLEIKRIPVRLARQDASTVRFASHAPRMLLDAFSLKGKWVRGIYRSEAIARIAVQEYWNERGGA